MIKKVHYKSKKRECEAFGNYNFNTNELEVIKGAKISSRQDNSFRLSKNANKRNNKEYVKNGILQENIKFSSPSIAAQFVSGSSLNGLKVWKLESGISLKSYLEEKRDGCQV